jgi:hypothetical protein
MLYINRLLIASLYNENYSGGEVLDITNLVRQG